MPFKSWDGNGIVMTMEMVGHSTFEARARSSFHHAAELPIISPTFHTALDFIGISSTVSTYSQLPIKGSYIRRHPGNRLRALSFFTYQLFTCDMVFSGGDKQTELHHKNCICHTSLCTYLLGNIWCDTDPARSWKMRAIHGKV